MAHGSSKPTVIAEQSTAGDLNMTEASAAAVKTAVEIIDNFISGARGLVTEDNSAAIKTAVELLDNAISGSEMQVDVVAPLPAGTNAIGKLAANSGVDIGDVDVTSLPAGSQAAATAKTSDYDTGGGTDTVAMQGIALPGSGGAVQGGTATNPVRIDPTGTTAQTVSQSVAGNLNMTEASAVAIKTAVELLDNFISGSRGLVTEDNSAAIKTAVELLDNAISGSEMQVDVVAPLPAGTNVLGGVTGNVAHDAADSGAPLKVGFKAVSHGATPSPVAASDRTDWIANRHGVPFVIGGHPNIERLVAKYTTAQTNTVLKTVDANERFVVTAISAYCDNANTVDVGVLFEFDAVTDVVIAEHPGVAAGSGFVEGSGAGILAIGGAAEDVLVTVEVPTGGSVTVHVSGYLIVEA